MCKEYIIWESELPWWFSGYIHQIIVYLNIMDMFAMAEFLQKSIGNILEADTQN